MKTLKIVLFWVIMFVPTQLTFSQDNGTIHDAVFSPDGKTLAVGTSAGLDLFHYPTMILFHHETFEEGGVHFIKWAPDGASFILAAWKEEEGLKPSKPVYLIYNFFSKSILAKFDNELRWITGSFSYLDYSYNLIHECGQGLYSSSYHIAHHNSIAFSPDGTEITLLTNTNRLLVRSYPSGDILRTLSPSEYSLFSVGYTADGNGYWTGTCEGPLLYLDRAAGNVVREVSQPSEVLDVSPDGVLAYVETPHYHGPPDHSSEIQYSFLLYDARSGDPITTLSRLLIYNSSHCRFLTLPEQHRLLVYHCDSEYSSSLIKEFIYTPTQPVGIPASHSAELDYKITYDAYSLAQPFSPDGKEVLVLDQGKLYVVDASDLEGVKILPYRQLLPSTSNVTPFEAYSSEKKGLEP